MRLIIEKNENVSWLVEKIFESKYKDLADFDIAIAGGFITSCWHSSLIAENPIVKSSISNYFDLSDKGISKTLDPYSSIIHNYNDIDIWIKEGYDVPKELDFLISDKKEEDKLIKNVIDSFGLKEGPHNKYGFKKSSKWANTFRAFGSGPHQTEVLQFMKKRFTDVRSLLKDFDFENCRFAYYKGNFYHTQGAVEAFESNELRLSNDKTYVKNKTLPI